jgi:predicted nucleic acid-binding protein
VRYLLDTNVLSEVIRKKPSRAVIDWLDRQEETSLYLSVITFGELQKGINKLAQSRRRKKLQDWVEKNLAERFEDRILDVDLRVAVRWGEISGTAEKVGKKVPVLDGLLAATALELGLTVVTGNVEHFEVTGVPWLDPWQSG